MLTNEPYCKVLPLFFMFMKEVSFAHQGCICFIKNTVKTNNVKYYYKLK